MPETRALFPRGPTHLAPKENPATGEAWRGSRPLCSWGARYSTLGPLGQRLPAVTCSGNRLDQIALRSQFGHWALRSEGAWGIFRVPHSLLLSPAWPKTGGAFS
jgi:hypothetical protein